MFLIKQANANTFSRRKITEGNLKVQMQDSTVAAITESSSNLTPESDCTSLDYSDTCDLTFDTGEIYGVTDLKEVFESNDQLKKEYLSKDETYISNLKIHCQHVWYSLMTKDIIPALIALTRKKRIPFSSMLLYSDHFEIISFHSENEADEQKIPENIYPCLIDTARYIADLKVLLEDGNLSADVFKKTTWGNDFFAVSYEPENQRFILSQKQAEKSQNVSDTKSNTQEVSDTESSSQEVLYTKSNIQEVSNTESSSQEVLDTKSNMQEVLDTKSNIQEVSDTESNTQDIFDKKKKQKTSGREKKMQ
jgi:hypothetical protein